MNLTIDDMEDISYIREEKAYKNILLALDQEEKYILECMDSFSDGIDQKLLPYLKAIRKINQLLRLYPDTIAEELKKYRESILQEGFEDILMRRPSELQLKLLKQYYEQRKEEMEQEKPKGLV